VEAKTWKRTLYHYLRWALLGGKQGPGIAESLEVLGREACLERIRTANLVLRELEVGRSKPVIEAAAFKGDADGKRRLEKEWKGYTL